MTEFLKTLRDCPLFAGIDQKDLTSMLHCLDGKRTTIRKDDNAFMEGDPVHWVGVVISGILQVVRDDYYGNRSVLTVLEPGDLFGEVFACAGVDTFPVSVFATRDSDILLLDCKRVLTVCPEICRFHDQLVRNLLQVVARKNLTLNQKIHIMSQKTTREKLMTYLSEQAKRQGSAEFTIPLDRQALADYLGVERSAMSAQLSKLRKDGILDYKGSWFRFYDVHPHP